MGNSRFKFRVWENNTRNCYLKDKKTAIVGDGDLIYGDMITNAMQLAYGADNPNIIVEQSTGLRDKNGNLIYESDYVKANDVIYRVFWNKIKISLANILTGDIIDVSETITMEIVGNEHEKDNISEIPKNTERRFN